MTTNEGNREGKKTGGGEPKPSPIKVGPGGAARTPIVVKPGGLTITTGALHASSLSGRIANVEIPGPDVEISEDESHRLAGLYNELFDYEEVFAYLNPETGEEAVALIDLPIPAQVIELMRGDEELVNHVEATIGAPSGQKNAAPRDRIVELYEQIFDVLEGLAGPTTGS